MTTATKIPALPTKADYKEAADLVYKADEALDFLHDALKRVDDYESCDDPTVQITIADIGEIFSFTAEVDMYLESACAKLEEIKTMLPSLDLMRGEIEHQARLRRDRGDDAS